MKVESRSIIHDATPIPGKQSRRGRGLSASPERKRKFGHLLVHSGWYRVSISHLIWLFFGALLSLFRVHFRLLDSILGNLCCSGAERVLIKAGPVASGELNSCC